MEDRTGSAEVESGPEEIRIVLIGGRWSGKSTSANTILRRETFGCGRIRTTASEVRHEVVEGRNLVVVDGPGWSSSFSLTEIPEGDKQRFRLNASKCPPGPNVFLLVIPLDTGFNAEQKSIVEEHMKLLAKLAWKYTMVLFTYGDFLEGKTVEQHIESEGDALKWVVEKCKNRYHVFNNKDKSNITQVSQLLEKIDEMVQENKGGHYQVDEQTRQIMEKWQKEIAERAEERREKLEEAMRASFSEKKTTLENLRMVVLGSRSVGKTSVVNTILRFKAGENGKRTAHSVKYQGLVGATQICIVDTPGWWKEYAESDTPEVIKDELKLSVFLCPPGPHIFLLVIDADASFNSRHLNAVITHLELLGDEVVRHTILIFTKGDWLGSQTIEQYIEGEGEALQLLVNKCGNRYHVLNNKDQSEAQVTELMDKITWAVNLNNCEHFTLDQQRVALIEDRRRKVEEGAFLRQIQISSRRKNFSGKCEMQQDLRLVMFGPKTFGKTTTANNILGKPVFAVRQNDQCQIGVADVAGRLVTVIDSPGWWVRSSRNTEELDKEIVRGLSLSPLGIHAILLVIPLELKFKDDHKVNLNEYMNLFDESVWKHVMVLFTFGDWLVDKSVEVHIEREHSALRWLVDQCENRYHVFNNMKKRDSTQVTELLEKVEEMVAENGGQLFCPKMKDVYLKIQDKARRRQDTYLMRQQMEREFTRRKLAWMMHSRQTFLDLQSELKASASTFKPKFVIGEVPKIKTMAIGQKKKEEKIDKAFAKIRKEVERLDLEILKSSSELRSSKEFPPPDMREESPILPFFEFWVDRRRPSGFSEEQDKLSNYQSTSSLDQSLGYVSERAKSVHDESTQDINVDFHMMLL